MINDSFVPVAIDINLLTHQTDSEGDFFRHIAEQGHFAGRQKPTPTRQGLYVTGVDGDLLHSLNSTEADSIISLMSRGLAKWDRKQKTNNVGKALRSTNTPDGKYVIDFPEGGMILRQTMRDLPRKSSRNHDTSRHNFDHAWLTAKEKLQFAPEQMKVGVAWQIPPSTVKRFASFHTVDQVHGEADAWNWEDVKHASMVARVRKVSGTKATIQLSGKVNCVKPPSGETNPYNKYTITKDITNDLSIKGWLVYDSKSKDFDSFRMVAAGMRSGTDLYNSRRNDMGPSPIGFSFEMLPDKPANRIKPKFLIWNYFEDDN